MPVYILISMLCVIIVYTNAAYTPSKETEIRFDTALNYTYDPTSRPADQTHVFISMSILAIDALDTKSQKFMAAGWLTFEWHDHRLTWNKTANDNMKYIFVKPHDIWRPEIVIDNSLEDLGVLHDDELLLRIKYDGTVDWEPLILFETHCEVDITFYPYDKQQCAVEVVSWMYTYDEIKLEHVTSLVNLDGFVENGEWQVMDTHIEDKNLTEHTTHGVVFYPQLDFWFYMDRRTDYYNMNVLMPILLNSLLVGLVYIVPVGSGEKIKYVLTVQLSLAVLLTGLSDAVPSTSITTSVLGLYVGIVFIFAGICVALTALVSMIYHRDSKPNLKGIYAKVAHLSAKMLCTKLGHNQGATATKVMPLTRNDDGEVVESQSDDITWQDIALMINRVFFYVFMSTNITMNIAFFLALRFGDD